MWISLGKQGLQKDFYPKWLIYASEESLSRPYPLLMRVCVKGAAVEG